MIEFLIGIAVGVLLGFFTAALMVASEEDEDDDL